MYLYPAIDIRNKQVVRLTQGDYDKMEVYSNRPYVQAQEFIKAGASHLHVVDLDGAKDGELTNFETIKEIVSLGKLFVEVGGGIRNEERIKAYLDLGVNRVILGTIAIENINFVKEMVNKYGSKIAVGVDASNGFVAIHGWKTITDKKSVDFCQELRDIGVETVIYTDISKDGALSGTNIDIYKELSNVKGLNIIASGGITYYDELETLKANGTYGAILGKALYAGKIDLAKAIDMIER